ncbi:hypothetical protein ABL78_4759 [Leptomonas seymouri]|uniref:Uncharacterized protein n=1 Tax=Leptomonas seymouri TaxID=5684 RepID=A0A0N1PBZ1_LEPSE|nr:hypothetical protein ABL78_4759 [Leptomonas seymouri]|eukprot:KPI86170.1 hypothetical protein ABL78_4759 [Leptomonas seymouri]
MVSIPGCPSMKIDFMPSSITPFTSPVARTAATATNWTDIDKMPKVYDVEDLYKGEGTRGGLSRSRSRSRSRLSLSVITDTDIDDECATTGTASTFEDITPLDGYRRLFKHCGAVAGAQWSAMHTSPTQTSWEESVTTEIDHDFSESAIAAQPRAAGTCQGSAACPLGRRRTFSQGSANMESSACLNVFDEETELQECCDLVEEEIPEETM